MEGFQGLLPTLYCGNMVGDSFVQVTEQSVRLIDIHTFALLFEFSAPSLVTVAHADLTSVVIACAGAQVIALAVVCIYICMYVCMV